MKPDDLFVALIKITIFCFEEYIRQFSCKGVIMYLRMYPFAVLLTAVLISPSTTISVSYATFQ